MTGDRPHGHPGRPRAAAGPDPVGAQLVGWGRAALLRTTGRATGGAHEVTVGFVDEPDGSILVAGAADAAWAANLLATPGCRVTIGERSFAAVAVPLDGADHARAIRELILRYGTPAERLGAGPSFRLRRATTGREGAAGHEEP